MEGVPAPYHAPAMRGRKDPEKGVSQIFDFINKIVRIVKNKNSGPSIKRKKTPRPATGRVIGFGMILAVVSIGIGVAIALRNNPGQQPAKLPPRPPVPGVKPPAPPVSPGSAANPPRELKSYVARYRCSRPVHSV